MNYYISDLHLGYANAIGFDGRPFADVTEMNETLIHRWNSAVSRADTIYVPGDFIWEKEKAIMEALQHFGMIKKRKAASLAE